MSTNDDRRDDPRVFYRVTRTKIWTGLGTVMLAGAALSLAPQAPDARPHRQARQAGGERLRAASDRRPAKAAREAKAAKAVREAREAREAREVKAAR